LRAPIRTAGSLATAKSRLAPYGGERPESYVFSESQPLRLTALFAKQMGLHADWESCSRLSASFMRILKVRSYGNKWFIWRPIHRCCLLRIGPRDEDRLFEYLRIEW